MAVTIKTEEEISILREGGRYLAKILQEVIKKATSGISTYELDTLAESLIFESGGKPSFKGYRIKGTRAAYPCTLCTSVNDEVVHAIPRKERILKEGDVVGLDIGMQWRRLFTDMAVTIGMGRISSEAEHLINITKESLAIGIKSIHPGARVGDVSYAIQQHLKKHKLGIIRDLAGHGVGYKVHEEPLIPNFGEPGTGSEFKEGMVLAIEPMATLGDWQVELQPDEWTFKTADGSLAAHFEHTIAVTRNGVEILTV